MSPQELHAAALALALDRGDRALFDRLAKMTRDEVAALAADDDDDDPTVESLLEGLEESDAVTGRTLLEAAQKPAPQGKVLAGDDSPAE